jgi:hypothetical protein
MGSNIDTYKTVVRKQQERDHVVYLDTDGRETLKWTSL